MQGLRGAHMMDSEYPIGTVITPNGLLAGLWALPRPLTGKWGSGALLDRMIKVWGSPDIIFGKTDQVEGFTVDLNPNVKPSLVADWANMPLSDKSYKVGYWDPPYLGHVDKAGGLHYSRLQPCYNEIIRVLSNKLFILHPLIYPCPRGWKRIAVIAITYGPNKIIRSLQGFERCYYA